MEEKLQMNRFPIRSLQLKCSQVARNGRGKAPRKPAATKCLDENPYQRQKKILNFFSWGGGFLCFSPTKSIDECDINDTNVNESLQIERLETSSDNRRLIKNQRL